MKLQPTINPLELSPAQRLPDYEFNLGSADLVAYGGATWDWHRLHHDRGYAESKGMSGTVVDGQMFGAIFAKHMTQWAGPNAFIQRLSVKYRAPAYADCRLTVSGAVVGISDKSATPGGAVTVDINLCIEGGEGVVAEAQAAVRFPRD